MKFTKFVYDGLMSIADSVVDPRSHSYPMTGGFNRDQKRLSGDVRKVGGDMKKAVNSYGRKQAHKYSSPK